TDMGPDGLEPIKPEETWYTEQYKKQLEESQIPVIQEMEIQRGKKVIRIPVGTWKEYLEEKEKRYAETLERHQKLFSELLKKKRLKRCTRAGAANAGTVRASARAALSAAANEHNKKPSPVTVGASVLVF